MNVIGEVRMVTKMRYNRFERARIIGARALQVSLGAPVLVKVPKDMVDPITIAMLEFEKNVIPITVRRVDSVRDEGEIVERPTVEVSPDLEEAREKALEKAEKSAQTVTAEELEIIKREKERKAGGEEPLDLSAIKALKAKAEKGEDKEKKETVEDDTGL
jgi:DNA-directed RNA polymerase subunit K